MHLFYIWSIENEEVEAGSWSECCQCHCHQSIITAAAPCRPVWLEHKTRYPQMTDIRKISTGFFFFQIFNEYPPFIRWISDIRIVGFVLYSRLSTWVGNFQQDFNPDFADKLKICHPQKFIYEFNLIKCIISNR